MAEQPHITLRELQRRVKNELEERFAQPLWVSAEISELKVNYSGHCYLELVEKGGRNGVPTAQARAMIWSSNLPRIATNFEAETGQHLAAGLQILARVMVTYHEIYGFALQIIDIDPSYTLGDMERQRQETILQLRKDGVWDMNREQYLPPCAQRVAVVSSANAAGYRDFMKELNKSPYRITTTLFDAFMQGGAAEDSIIEALCRIADRQEEFDVVVIIRGGGSVSDLNCFNAYRLCSYVAQFPLPVATGIGHDKDISVADMVAYQMLKTPTAVAGWLVELAAQLESKMNLLAVTLENATRERTHAEALRLERMSGDCRRLTESLLSREKLRIEQLRPTLAERITEFLRRRHQQLDRYGEVVEAHSPERVLKLGFALLHAREQAITHADEVTSGDILTITLSDGEITATVNTTKIWQKKS